MLEDIEQIISVLFSVWGTEKGLFKRGREGMLVLTSKRIAFVSKTKMNINWWRDEVKMQLKSFKQSSNTIRVSDEYTIERLTRERLDETNVNISIKQVLVVEFEQKRWGSELKIKFEQNGGVKMHKFAIVKGWTTYPVKDPVAFLYVDWKPWISALKSNM